LTGGVVIESTNQLRDRELFKPKLRLEDVMEILDISRASAYKHCKDGKIPGAFQVGRSWRIHRDIFEAWLSNSRK